MFYIVPAKQDIEAFHVFATFSGPESDQRMIKPLSSYFEAKEVNKLPISTSHNFEPSLLFVAFYSPHFYVLLLIN